jgi:molybdopterin converting factor small subunit
MSVTVELTYDMGKTVGEWSFELDEALTVKDVVEQTKARFGPDGDAYQQLSRVAAVAVNGVLISYRKGLKTPLQDGDTVAFVKAAAGG